MKWVTRERPFRRIGAGLGGGSGWVVLGFNQHARQLENHWMADHAPAPAAAKYIDAFFQNVNREKVNARLNAAGATKT